MNARNDDRGSRPQNPAAPSSLPLRGSQRAPRRIILASHLVFTGYAHWFPNDLRGSGSEEIRKDEIAEMGEILPGRQFPQPRRDQVKRFFRAGEQRIDHERVWFREAHRHAIAEAFGKAARERG